jgi:putative glutamine amidotransferase
MSPDPVRRIRVGIPYRTRNEELTGDFAKIEKYVTAVKMAGGEPVIVSLGRAREELKKLVGSLDAVVLSGSPADVDPSLFHAARHPKTNHSDPYRDQTDFTLLEYAFAEQKPVLAICYGIQSLNVFLGGTLVQDIPSEVEASIEHESEDAQGASETFHPIRIHRDSMLARIAGGSEAQVNSSHHQSVLEPGRNLQVVARSEDQVIEAIEWTGDSNWVMGVQWHPERMVEKDALAQSLFRTLIGAARRATLQA